MVLGLVVALDLIFAPWFSIGAGVIAFHIPAVKAPDGIFAISAAAAAGGVVAAVLIDRAISPTVRVFSALLSVAALVGVALKFAVPPVHSLTVFGFGFWGAAILVVVMVVVSLIPRPGP